MSVMTSYRLFGSALLSFGLAVGAAGCAYDLEESEAPALDSPDELEPQGIYGNGLLTLALSRNALVANPSARNVMVNVPLDTSSYADNSPYPELRRQLHHPLTRLVMSYLVRCALGPTQEVSYTDTLTGASYSFSGEIGLCPAWASGPASTNCQQEISGCVLALNNGLGKKVTISLRGEVPGMPPGSTPGPVVYPSSVVPTVQKYENGDLVESFVPCASATAGVSRNCGWEAEHVGTCAPGSRVYVGAGAKPPAKCSDASFPVLGSSTGDTVLRVCEGIRGCNTTSANFIDMSGASCGTSQPALGFTCPPSGYYSVMSGPQTSGGPGVAAPAAQASGPAKYPAPEADVFTWQEGAFYGSLWGPGSLHPSILPGMNNVDVAGNFVAAPPVVGSVFPKAFACTGRFWTDQEAYMKDRICAGGDEDCAATSVGACDTANDNTPSCPPRHLCSIIDGPMVPGDGDFHGCAGTGGASWANPVSVYLNGPSDIVVDTDHSATRGTPSAPLPPLCP